MLTGSTAADALAGHCDMLLAGTCVDHAGSANCCMYCCDMKVVLNSTPHSLAESLHGLQLFEQPSLSKGLHSPLQLFHETCKHTDRAATGYLDHGRAWRYITGANNWGIDSQGCKEGKKDSSIGLTAFRLVGHWSHLASEQVLLLPLLRCQESS